MDLGNEGDETNTIAPIATDLGFAWNLSVGKAKDFSPIATVLG
jgi:hypothetical protein